jgi:3-hydroxymyristoyl/3-hydroxydecanoyl-(acyl carrier protein) dehydratase
MVKEAIICGEEKKGKKVKITGVKKVRFRQPAKPDDMLIISYSPSTAKENQTYSFKVSLAEQVMCIGTMLAVELINV